MTSSTTNFSLPFPDGGDRPCDFAQQWCDFTDALDVVLDRFQATLDRVMPMIPIASLKVSEPTVFTSFGLISYDAVVIDSAGWTTVDLDSTQISPDMAAVMTFSSNVVLTQVQAPGAFFLDPVDTTGVVVEPFLPYAENMDMNQCPVGIPLEDALLFSPGHWVPGISGLRNSISVSTLPTLTIENALFTVYWHSDGGTV